jgi:hypothetical protein
VAIVRNLTLVECAPGHPMTTPPTPVLWGTSVSGVVLGHRPVIVERKRFITELMVTAAGVQTKAIDYPPIASAPPPERRT